jgi:hypothetical protein
MGRGHDRRTRRAWATGAERRLVRILDQSEELPLMFERHRSDLVEKQDSALGAFDGGQAICRVRASARPAAEELALETTGRDRSAVDDLQGAADVWRGRENRPRYETLTGSRLSDDE